MERGQNGRPRADGSDMFSIVIRLLHSVHGRLTAENRPHAAEPSGKHDHLGMFKVGFLYGAVGLDGNTVPRFDHRAADARKLNLHTAPAQNVARRDGFDRLKAGTQNHNNHFYSSRQAAMCR